MNVKQAISPISKYEDRKSLSDYKGVDRKSSDRKLRSQSRSSSNSSYSARTGATDFNTTYTEKEHNRSEQFGSDSFFFDDRSYDNVEARDDSNSQFDGESFEVLAKSSSRSNASEDEASYNSLEKKMSKMSIDTTDCLANDRHQGIPKNTTSDYSDASSVQEDELIQKKNIPSVGEAKREDLEREDPLIHTSYTTEIDSTQSEELYNSSYESDPEEHSDDEAVKSLTDDVFTVNSVFQDGLTIESSPYMINKDITKKGANIEEQELFYIEAVEHLIHRRFHPYIDLITDHPKLLAVRSKKNQTILHIIAMQIQNFPENVILKTISQDPNLVRLTDNDENTPLHYAAMSVHTETLSAFQIFLNFHPTGAGERNKGGDLPVHLAAGNNKPGSEEAVRLLLEAFPKGITVSNNNGQVPLHLACVSGCKNSNNVGILLSMHKVRKSDISILDTNGNSPLHAAIKYGCPYETISVFNEEARDNFLNAYIEKDDNGDIPLHTALKKKHVDPKIVLSLIKVAPYTGGMQTQDGKMPIQLATKAKLEDKIIEEILASDLPVELGKTRTKEFSENNIVYRDHGHSWWHVAIECKGKYVSMLTNFLSKNATLSQIIALALSVGPDNTTATKVVASKDLRTMFKNLLRFLDRYEILIDSMPLSDGTIQDFAAIDHGDAKKVFASSSSNSTLEVKSCKSPFLSDGYTAIMGDKRKDNSECETEVAYVPWKRVSREVRLRCYAFEEDFDSEINERKRKNISSEFVEDILNTHRYEDNLDVANNLQVRYLHTIAFEHNDSTLEAILNEKKTYRNFDLWLVKCHIILKNTASALKHLHKRGLVHGYLSPSTIGSFINKWKLLEIGMAVPIGHAMNGSMRRSSPPEAVIMPPIVKKERSNELKINVKQKGALNKKVSTHLSVGESVRSRSSTQNSVFEEQVKQEKKRFFSSLRSKSRTKMEPEHYVMENPKMSRKRLGIFIFSMQDMGLADYGWKPDNRLMNGSVIGRETDASLSDTLPSQIGHGTVTSASQSALTKISMQEEEIIRLKKALEEKDKEYRKQLALERMQFKKNEINMHKEMKEVKENGKANASRTVKRTKARFAPEKVMASPSWDIWSLGVIMARLILGETTYLPAFEESDEEFLEKSLEFNVSKLLAIQEEVSKKAGVLAADLIHRLLHPSPSQRINSMSKVLQHKYFHEEVKSINQGSLRS